MNKSYMTIFDRMADGTLDPARVGLALAKARPDIFLAIDAVFNEPTPASDGKLLEYVAGRIWEAIDSGDKVGAIKEFRACVKCGLKEAKDEIDFAIEKRRFSNRGLEMLTFASRGQLGHVVGNDALLEICDRLVLRGADEPATSEGSFS